MEKYAAKVENGIVVQTIVGDPEWAFTRLGGEWHGTDAKVGIDWTYEENEGFRPPQPYSSWAWADDSWHPPVPYPNDGGLYMWDEETLSWATVTPISDQGDF